MGSLFSGPKVPQPKAQKIVYVPAATATYSPASNTSNTPSSSSVNTSSSTSTSDTEVEENVSVDEEQSSARVENLLRRNRGVSGTVKTGFRGLLSTNDLQPVRKSLLGE